MGTSRALCRVYTLFCLTAALTICNAAQATIWTKYKDAYKKNSRLPLPDWSFAGYHHSEVAIPSIYGPVFDVTRWGARGDGRTFNDKAVQNAINAAAKAGGGVIYFPKGKYLFGQTKNKPYKKDSVLSIQSSNIVFRGAGASDKGTVLKLHREQIGTPFLEVRAKSGGGNKKIAVLQSTANENDMYITVDTVTNLKKEKCFRIRYGDTGTYRNKGKGYVQQFYGKSTYLSKKWVDVAKIGVTFFEYHCIKRIDTQRRRVYLTEPIRQQFVKHSTPFEIWAYRPVKEVGIEDLVFEGSWNSIKKPFCHHCSPLDDWGWTALWLSYVRNFWIRNCEFRHWNQGVRLYQTSQGTIRDVTYTGKKGHHSIESRQSYGTLIMDNKDYAAHHHGPSVSFFDEGTVYLRHQMKSGQRIDAHASNPTNSLFDDVRGGVLSGSGGNIKDYPNHGGGLTFWNFWHRGVTAEEKKQSYSFWPKSPSDGKSGGTTFLRPNIIGLYGDKVSLKRNTVNVMESIGSPVEPRSLFTAQLCLRLGQAQCPNGVPIALGKRRSGSYGLQEGGDSQSESSQKGLKTVAVIGIAIGCLALVVLVAGAIVQGRKTKVREVQKPRAAGGAQCGSNDQLTNDRPLSKNANPIGANQSMDTVGICV